MLLTIVVHVVVVMSCCLLLSSFAHCCLQMSCVCCVVLFSSRVKAIAFISMSVDELCDQVTSFEHGKVREELNMVTSFKLSGLTAKKK